MKKKIFFLSLLFPIKTVTSTDVSDKQNTTKIGKFLKKKYNLFLNSTKKIREDLDVKFSNFGKDLGKFTKNLDVKFSNFGKGVSEKMNEFTKKFSLNNEKSILEGQKTKNEENDDRATERVNDDKLSTYSDSIEPDHEGGTIPINSNENGKLVTLNYTPIISDPTQNKSLVVKIVFILTCIMAILLPSLVFLLKKRAVGKKKKKHLFKKLRISKNKKSD